MSRETWVCVKNAQGKIELVEKSKYVRPVDKARVQIIPDIQPYQSVITGETIGGRAQHRSHLKDHNCIEVGNEKFPERRYDERAHSESVRRDLKRALQEQGHL